MMQALREYLVAHKERTGRDGDQLVFASIHGSSFTASNIRRKANAAWAAENKRRDQQGIDTKVEPIGLHELRHSHVSFLSDSGLSLERIGDFVGHSSTFMVDRYRHLLNDDARRDELAALLDAYADRSSTGSRIAQLDA